LLIRTDVFFKVIWAAFRALLSNPRFEAWDFLFNHGRKLCKYKSCNHYL
jgi:hypothetical protein